MSTTWIRRSNYFDCSLVQLATVATSLSMARVLIVGILALLFLQLAAGQNFACMGAITALVQNAPACALWPPLTCSGSCRLLYDAVINSCDHTVSQLAMVCKISCLCACLASSGLYVHTYTIKTSNRLILN